MIYYKIRNKAEPNLFHKGGIYENWSKTGKIWPTLGQLRSMITMNMNGPEPVNMNNWEIVEYEVTEKAVKNVHDIISQKKLVELLIKN